MKEIAEELSTEFDIIEKEVENEKKELVENKIIAKKRKNGFKRLEFSKRRK